MGRVLCLLLVAVSFSSAAAENVRPGPWPMRGYVCARATDSVVIDGLLDDAAWAAAPWTDDFTDIEGDRRPAPTRRTRAKMLWDDDCFYIAADLEEPHLWATLRERDAVIYHDNDFEVFIDPDGDSHLYTEIEINALNTVWDLLLVRPYRDGGPAIHAWDIPGLRTAVHLSGTLNDPTDTDCGWSVEIAIPWPVLDETTDAACPPAAGDRWRVNFSRVQWRLDATDDGYRKTIDPATGRAFPENNWVWSPQRLIAMHEPEHWGIVEFRETAGKEAVEPGPEDRAAWHLRFSSYLLAAERELTGAWPETLVMHRSEAPDLSRSWSWPPAYARDGERYTLTLYRKGGPTGLRLCEDGRLVRLR